MKWASKRVKEKLLKAGSWQEPPSIGDRFTKEDARNLDLAIVGNVVLPFDATYFTDRLLSNYVFQSYPLIIAYCEVFNDVRHCLEFAKKHGLQIAIRSGGHSTAGLSINDGFVIDLSRMRYAVVDPEKKQVTVGGGTSFGYLNACLDAYGLHVPGGGCDDVCVGGFVGGGGYGYTSRTFGLNCDNVISIRAMLADGRIVIANAKRNADLFWALRGGMGGNLAVILEITYRVHEISDLWGFQYQWPLVQGDKVNRNAARVLALLHDKHTVSGQSDDLGYSAFLAWQKGEPCLMIRGMFNGTRANGQAVLKSILGVPGATTILDDVGSYLKLAEWLIYEAPAIPDVPDIAREDKVSCLVARLIKEDEWLGIIELFLETPNQSSMLGVEPYGGAISRVAVGDTAFIHRDAHLNIEFDVFWVAEGAREEAVRYLDRVVAFLKPYSNGRSTQTYPRQGQADYRRRYWGEWFETLLAVKHKYDRGNVFSHAMALVPEEGRTASPPLHRVPQLDEPVRDETWSTGAWRT